MKDGYSKDGPEGFGNHEFLDFNGINFTYIPKEAPKKDEPEEPKEEPQKEIPLKSIDTLHDSELKTHGVMHYDGGWVPGPHPDTEEFEPLDSTVNDSAIYSDAPNDSATIGLNGEGDAILIGSILNEAPGKTIMAVFNTHDESASLDESKASALIPVTDKGSTDRIIDSLNTDFNTTIFDEDTTVVFFTNSEKPIPEDVLEKLYDNDTKDVRRVNTASETEIQISPGHELMAYVDGREIFAYPNEGTNAPTYSPNEIINNPELTDALADNLNENKLNWLVTRNQDNTDDYKIRALAYTSEETTELVLTLNKGRSIDTEIYQLTAQVIDESTVEVTSLPIQRYSEDDDVSVPESMLGALTELSAQAGYLEVRLARPTDLQDLTPDDKGYDAYREIVGSNDPLEIQEHLEELYHYVAIDSGFKEKGGGWGRLTPKR